MSLTTSAPASTSTCELIGINSDLAANVHNATEISYFCEWLWPTQLSAVDKCCTNSKKAYAIDGGCHHWCLVNDEADSLDETSKFFSCLASVDEGLGHTERGCMLVGPRRTKGGLGSLTTSTAASSATIHVTMSTSANAAGGTANPAKTNTPGNAGVSSKSVTIGGVLISSLALVAFLL